MLCGRRSQVAARGDNDLLAVSVLAIYHLGTVKTVKRDERGRRRIA